MTKADKITLAHFEAAKLVGQKCAGETITAAWTKAPGNEAPIGGLKVTLKNGSWFALRPSGTEPTMKLYLESFKGPVFLDQLLKEAPGLVFG